MGGNCPPPPVAPPGSTTVHVSETISKLRGRGVGWSEIKGWRKSRGGEGGVEGKGKGREGKGRGG